MRFHKTFLTKHSLWFLWGLGIITLSVLGCQSNTPIETEGIQYSQEGSKKVNASEVAQLSGNVYFDGEAPTPKVSSIQSFTECALMHSHKVYSNRILIQDGKLQNVFVYIHSGLEDYEFLTPTTSKMLDQKGCLYIPHVMGIQIHQKLRIKNSDTTLHNVHAQAKNQKAFNIGMPVQGMVIPKKFDSQEIMIPLSCNVHSWMRAYVGVLPHPYYSVSDEKGEFKLENIPAGEYEIVAWHEVYGTQSQRISLNVGESKSLEFRFQPN